MFESAVACRGAVLVGLGLASSLGAYGEYSLYFGAPGGAVAVERLALPQDLGAFAVELRIKTSAKIRQPVRLVSLWSDDAQAEDPGAFFLELRASNRLAFGLRDREGRRESVSSRGWRDGRWHHVSASWDGGEMAIHLDGEEVARRAVPEFGPLATSALPLVIGPPQTRGRKARAFEGFLGGVSLWTRARDVQAIREALEFPPEVGESGLLAYFPLREKAPTATVADRSGGRLIGELSPALACAGWCHTLPWDDEEPDRPYLDLFCHDLAAYPAAIVRPEWRKILVTHEKAQRVGVLWQDAASRAIRIAWIDPATSEHEIYELEGRPDGVLAAGTTDPQGNVYHLVIQQSTRDRSEDVALIATLRKASASGEALRAQTFDTSRSGFNLYTYTNRGAGQASLRYQKGTLGLILPRTMYRSGDGLRHQGAIAVTFSAKDLHLLRNLGTTSSHSKGNILTAGSKGDFLGLDLGDNYPRGLHLHRFTATAKTSRVIYTYKTAHATSSRNGAPVYEEISGDGRTFYRWSNDNETYTELGGIVEGRKAYVVVFSTERSLDGKVLDNSRAFRNNGDPRDLALLLVLRAFQKAPRGSEVSDAIIANLRRGARAETGGFYNFGGGWTPQRVVGVSWLTNYEANESARAPQVIPLEDDILILWEKAYHRSSTLQAMRIDERGRVRTLPFGLDLDLTLNRMDRVLRLGDSVYFLAHERKGEQARLYSFRVDS